MKQDESFWSFVKHTFNESKKTHAFFWFCLKLIAGVYGAWLVGAMLDFSMFPANDLTVREIAYCTEIICVTVAICIRKYHKPSDGE